MSGAVSAFGTKRTWHRGGLISAFGGKANTRFAAGLGVLGLLGWRRRPYDRQLL